MRPALYQRMLREISAQMVSFTAVVLERSSRGCAVPDLPIRRTTWRTKSAGVALRQQVKAP